MPDRILVLDNASRKEDFCLLMSGCEKLSIAGLQVYRSESNLGFAQGCNNLIDESLKDISCRYLFLLNNDAVAEEEMIRSLRDSILSAAQPVGMAGGRVHKLSDPTQVDTLGIAIYASLMPADRKVLEDRFIGPTGGCCLLTREFLEHIQSVFGYYFDARFFCYCEDTDLALRALLLGYKPVYVDQLVALHEGQASSGQVNNFIAFHGLRNVFWMQIKLIPSVWMWRYGILMFASHFLMIVKYSLTGKWGLVVDIYKDVYKGIPEFWRERRKLGKYMKENGSLMRSLLTPRFYRKNYFGELCKSHAALKRGN